MLRKATLIKRNFRKLLNSLKAVFKLRKYTQWLVRRHKFTQSLNNTRKRRGKKREIRPVKIAADRL